MFSYCGYKMSASEINAASLMPWGWVEFREWVMKFKRFDLFRVGFDSGQQHAWSWELRINSATSAWICTLPTYQLCPVTTSAASSEAPLYVNLVIYKSPAEPTSTSWVLATQSHKMSGIDTTLWAGHMKCWSVTSQSKYCSVYHHITPCWLILTKLCLRTLKIIFSLLKLFKFNLKYTNTTDCTMSAFVWQKQNRNIGSKVHLINK